MRNTNTLLSRPTGAPSDSRGRSPSPAPPAIRIIEATEPNTSYPAVDQWAAPPMPSPLAPRQVPTAKGTARKLVPKKSKLSLLGVGSKDKGKDLSDVVRRVGGSTKNGFDIYVDQYDDDTLPDSSEIVMIGRKKSRVGLNGMRWGDTEEVTKVPSVAKENRATLNVVKPDQNKWWSIGRGRKDSKEKGGKENKQTKEPPRAKAPEVEPSRGRFNSLDSGILLASAPILAPVSIRPSLVSLTSAPATGTFNGHLAPTSVPLPDDDDLPPSSIAIRAMRSVRSLARMGSWGNLRSNPALDEPSVAAPVEEVEQKTKTKTTKKKTKKEKKVQPATVRSSGSSFEAGALTASPQPEPQQANTSSLSKKRSFLGLVGMGLPSTMRLPTVRGGSNASSIGPAASVNMNRLSVESRDRPASTISDSSSLRPTSETSSLRPLSDASLRPLSVSSDGSRLSAASRLSSSSSAGSSVRWDEEGLETVKERRKKEREFVSREDAAKPRASKEGRETRRGSDGRRRTSLAAVFPDAVVVSPIREHPVLTLEEATTDGHSDDVYGQTPAKQVRPRPRPKSEQLLGKSRPQGIHEGGNAVISMLDAATADLEQLIGYLDLEATPGATPGQSPWKPTPFSQERHENAIRMLNTDSPTKSLVSVDSPMNHSPLTLRKKVKGLRTSAASATSLRPYAQMRGNTLPSPPTVHTYRGAPAGSYQFIGQHIAPWQTLNQIVSPSPKKLRVKHLAGSPSKKGPLSSRTATPVGPVFSLPEQGSPPPAADPSPVFHALRPPKAKASSRSMVISSIAEVNVFNNTPLSMTFGPRSPQESINDGNSSMTASPTPVFRRAHARKQSSLVPLDRGLPMASETKRGLGMRGTMGGSSTSQYDANRDDPDSDIPDELANIIQSQSDEDDSMRSSPPASPLPELPGLPVFRLTDELDNMGDLDESSVSSSSEDDTKKSFDFTGELQKLNESGAGDRRSFVEQVENAFRTPARVDLHYAINDGFLNTTDAPPVPPIPASLQGTIKKSDYSSFHVSSSCTDSFSVSQLNEIPQPTLLKGAGYDDSMETETTESYREYQASMMSRPSNGELNTSFRFGGAPRSSVPSPRNESSEIPLTLSDIIPSPSHTRSTSMCSIMDDTQDSGFVMHSILPQAEGASARPRARMDSDASSRRQSGRYRHSRNSSEMSFAGFDSFAEVRRGYEFMDDSRPAFYPPAAAAHNRHESVFSIASVSSYGAVINSGSADPFDFGAHQMLQRPLSEDMSDSMSMSMSIDDTFSFLKKDPQQRKRVASDASSFYFQAPSTANMSSYTRGHRREQSNMSIASQGPPISLHNRSFNFAAHRRNDSNGSISSVAQSYAMYGANGGRAAYARHRQDASMDSIMSDLSAMRVGGRGGLSGDKMLESAMDYGGPLAAISASPPESLASARVGNRSSYDSICETRMDDSDSLFEKTNHRSSSVSSGSVFGYDDLHPPQGNLLPPGQFRPLSVLSFDHSIHAAPKDDDTMITMLGGGHVRRMSVGSVVGQSPCMRVEKRKHSAFRGAAPKGFIEGSPLKARIVEKASIASTSSTNFFGQERMIKAKHGLLQRQSLEDHCLSGEGEDMNTSILVAPVFSRPGPASRSRSSTCTSYTTSSSGTDTPPLSCEDGVSSMSEGSVSSIDLSGLNIRLANATHPLPTFSRPQARPRARGQGHNRRRMSQAHARASRSSVYETIEEELSSASSASRPSSPFLQSPAKKAKNNAGDAVFTVEADISSINIWDDEAGLEDLRRYYRLKDEANFTVVESKRTWMDTPFSLFTLQSFEPPSHPAGMQAMLDASVQNYGPLPAEVRRRIRVLSRPSPYPQRTMKTSITRDDARPVDNSRSFANQTAPLREKYVPNNMGAVFSRPVADKAKTSPAVMDKETRDNILGMAPPVRPRVASSARRSNLGWSKRSTGATGKENPKKENKENVVGQGSVMTPGETLRLSRPRPRGRPTPASARPVRV